MKKLSIILPLALILCFMVGCQDKEAMAELEEFRAQAAVEEQNKELVRQMYEAIDEQDFETFSGLSAPDGV
jgi:PBP1b-binding outer membrane lipoprotein LpoB